MALDVVEIWHGLLHAKFDVYRADVCAHACRWRHSTGLKDSRLTNHHTEILLFGKYLNRVLYVR